MAVIAGHKWLIAATYLTPEIRQLAIQQAYKAKREGWKRINMRPASYIGEPSPLVCIEGYAPGSSYGSSIYTLIYEGGVCR